MTWRAPREPGPEPLPPGELLRIRDELTAPPRPEIRHRHLADAAAEARSSRGAAAHAAHAMARRGARVIAGVAGIIVVTSGLAGAQILPEPARSLTAAVTERLVPSDPEPAPEEVPVTGDTVAEEPESTTTAEHSDGTDGRKRPADTAVAASADEPEIVTTTSSTAAPSTTSSTTSSTSTSTTTSSTTVPDTSTSTTVPGSSTTTSTTTTTTTSTTAPSRNSPPPQAPAFGRTGSDPGAG